MTRARTVLLVGAAVICALAAGGAAHARARPEPLRAGTAPAPDRSLSDGRARAQAPAGTNLMVYRDVPYREVDGVTLLLDIYAPATGGPYPGVLVIHGGGWRSGDKRGWEAEGRRLAEAGFAAFVVNYRLAPPGGRWQAPAPIEDVQAAARWVRTHGAAYNADPTRLGALGGSAGGHLAMMLGTTGQAGAERVEAVVSWSGPTALSLLSGNDAGRIVENFVGCGLHDCPERWQAASPAVHVDGTSAPMYLATSTNELVPLSQATLMAERLSRAGVPHELRILEGRAHARAYEDRVWDESVRFLRNSLGG
jgi:acetyl esterase